MNKFEKEYVDRTGCELTAHCNGYTYSRQYVQWLEQKLVKLLDLHDVVFNEGAAEVEVCEHEWVIWANSFDQTCYCQKCGASN